MKDYAIFIIPILVAAITHPLFDGLQKMLGFLDSLPAWAKQVAAASIAFGLMKGAALVGVTLNIMDPAQLTQENVAALASAGLTFLFKSHADAKVAA